MTALLAGSALAVSGCTGGGAGSAEPPPIDVAPAQFQLVSYDSCAELLAGLKKSVAEYVTAWGLGSGPGLYYAGAEQGGMPDARDLAAAPAAGAAPPAAAPAAGPTYSGTNTHEAGVDEPDLVKTDGRRIVTLMDGILRVVDPSTKQMIGRLELSDQRAGRWYATQLLLAGDRALAIGTVTFPIWDPVEPRPMDDGGAPDVAMPTIYPAQGTRLVLIDLSSAPRVTDTVDLEGMYVDARQVGSVARLVIRSTPHLRWVYPEQGRSEAEARRANREVLSRSTAADWLPRYSLNGGAPEQLLSCADVRHPHAYAGTSMLTVLSVDVAGTLMARDSTAIVGDGQTVYGTGSSLYVADDHRGFILPMVERGDVAMPAVKMPQTEVHKFDVSQPGKPRYVASGAVAGWLLNQYSLSEFDGYLRIATTERSPVLDDQGGIETPQPVAPRIESSVTVLAQRGDRLVAVGRVGGLGKGEQLYSVRFIGPVGYVVTFRQTDPLYTLDLSDPARPRVVGELKITGFSSYLHPVGDGRLLGVGQDATSGGRVQGAQVSLFDVGNPATPRRLDAYALPGSWSEAQNDPHAFLYWPDDDLVVVPVWAPPVESSIGGRPQFGGALVLQLDGDSLVKVGFLAHPVSGGDIPERNRDSTIRRSLVIGDTLWTVSGAGAMASDVHDLAQLGWVPFT